MTWQPIETAPKDGTIFIGCWRYARVSCGGGPAEDQWMICDARWQEGRFRFREEMTGTPTHWMPFTPPSTSKE